MNLADKQKRYGWLKSQARWHGNRNGAWHKRQAKFYRKQAALVFTFSEIVSLTLSKYSKQFVENLSMTNALVSRLKTLAAK